MNDVAIGQECWYEICLLEVSNLLLTMRQMISESSVDARKENWHENMSKGSNFWIIGLSTLGSFMQLTNDSLNIKMQLIRDHWDIVVGFGTDIEDAIIFYYHNVIPILFSFYPVISCLEKIFL